jgi:hypothetical protein
MLEELRGRDANERPPAELLAKVQERQRRLDGSDRRPGPATVLPAERVSRGMDPRSQARAIVGAVGLGVAGAAVWTGVDYLRNRGVERVPYKPIGEIAGVEFRRYPETIRVQTTAPTSREAFFRLFRYIDGTNAGGQSVSMTTPVATEDDSDGATGDDGGTAIEMTAPVETRAGTPATDGGESIAMTAPVATEAEAADEDGVTMSFFLPEEYAPETAPEPTEEGVELVVDPPRTLAVLGFSWWTPEIRVARKRRELSKRLDEAGIEPVDEPQLLRYDGPGTPPWRRTNEVVVEVKSDDIRRALGNA